MHGHVHLCLREFVIEYYGKDIWLKVLEDTKLDDDNDFMLFHYYKDESTFKLVGAIVENTGLTLPEVLESYGHHFYVYASTRGYDRMMKTLGRDFCSFVQNLDLLHSLLALTYKGMRPPQFRCEQKNGKIYVHVYTVHPGMYPVAVGTLTEVAKQIFNTEIKMILIERRTGQVFDSKFCEHVTFEVKIVGEDNGIGIAEARMNRQSVVIDTGMRNPMINNEKQCLVSMPSVRMFTAMPYSVIFDRHMHIVGAGLHLRTLCPDIQKKNVRFSDIFEIKEPCVTLSYQDIMNLSNTYMYFFLQVRTKEKNVKDEELDCPILRGLMIPLEGQKQIAFIGNPFFESLGDLLKAKAFLTNIPQDQITMEIMFMNEQRRADMQVSQRLDETMAIMKKLSAALEVEKKKTDTLLHQMLPVQVANQLREGKTVDAVKHDCVTILFSDIVSFTTMSAQCEPIQVVSLLNDMFRRFDNLTTKFDVYKVETIGDAYMVVAGVPETINDHAERIARMGLAMQAAVTNVISPISKKPIQIRVGVHTGPVVSGVVGTKMPRYCLFGDTVNTASRMESHGLAGEVHISDSTYRQLTGKNFLIDLRGETEIKGKGKMLTYLVKDYTGKETQANNEQRHDISNSTKDIKCELNGTKGHNVRDLKPEAEAQYNNNGARPSNKNEHGKQHDSLLCVII